MVLSIHVVVNDMSKSNHMRFERKYAKPLEEKIGESLDIIKKYSRHNSVVLWSGGKDSTVLHHLVLSVDKTVMFCLKIAE